MNLEQNHHYRALLNTIDFFSQRLHTEQIIHYGYKIFEDLTLPKSGGILTINETKDAYIPREQCNLPQELVSIPVKDCHKEFASKNGFLLDNFDAQRRYFKEGFLLAYNVDIIMPLIVGDSLYGFIIAAESDNATGIKNREFLNRFLDLLNLALEKAVNFEKSTAMEKEINRRKFSGASFAQTMNILMTTLDQDYIVNMCLDVARELTSSSVTSIMTERRSNHLVLSAYKDIVNHKECIAELTIKEGASASNVIYHVERDRQALEDILLSTDVLERLEAEYIVFLQKDKIIGCITLGKPVSGISYDRQLLDQIKGLASAMYIALSNASKYETIKEERNKMSEQLDALEHLKRSISIINGSDSLEELCDNVIDTLQYGFYVEEAFVLVNKSTSTCMSAVNTPCKDMCDVAKTWLEKQEEAIIHYTSMYENPFFNESSNCFLCLPLKQQGLHEKILGHLVITKMARPLDEGQTLIFETLANSISPVIKQFLIIASYQNDYIKKPNILLEELIHKYDMESELYEIPYYIYIKNKEIGPVCVDYEHDVMENGERFSVGALEVLFLYDECQVEDFEQVSIEELQALKKDAFHKASI